MQILLKKIQNMVSFIVYGNKKEFIIFKLYKK